MNEITNRNPDGSVDLTHLPHLSIFNFMPESSERKYKSSWTIFCQCSYPPEYHSKPPTEAMLMDFFVKRRKAGYAGTSLWSIYSHLNKIVNHLWDIRLQNYKKFTNYLKAMPKEDTKKTASSFLTQDDLEKFFKGVDPDDRYVLVRAVVAIFSYVGALKIDQLKKLKMKNVRPNATGYTIFVPTIRDRGKVVAPKKFRVERIKNDPNVCYASIIDEYFTALETDFGQLPEPDEDFFYTARKETETNPPRFTNITMGINTMRQSGIFIAECIGLENPESYSGNTFKRHVVINGQKYSPEKSVKNNDSEKTGNHPQVPTPEAGRSGSKQENAKVSKFVEIPNKVEDEDVDDDDDDMEDHLSMEEDTLNDENKDNIIEKLTKENKTLKAQNQQLLGLLSKVKKVIDCDLLLNLLPNQESSNDFDYENDESQEAFGEDPMQNEVINAGNIKEETFVDDYEAS